MDISKIVPAATALREAARRIEAGEVNYDWGEPTNCNCGIVAQVVLRMSVAGLFRLLERDEIGLWSCAVHPDVLACPVTHLPMNRVIRMLYESGLSVLDIMNLEYLWDEAVRFRAGLTPSGRSNDHDDTRCVVRYMRALADIIDERGELPARTAREAELVGA